MSNHAAHPAAIPYVSLQTVPRTLPNPTQSHLVCYSPPSGVGQGPPRRAAVSADFIGRERDESYVPEHVSRSVSRVLFGHGFRACPAPGGSSLFCFSCTALRVTVSLQISFGKCAEKISP